MRAPRAAALVCSRWRDPAQSAVFSEVVLDQSSSTAVIQLFRASGAQPKYRTKSLSGLTPSGMRIKGVAQACDRPESLVIADLSEPDSGLDWAV